MQSTSDIRESKDDLIDTYSKTFQSLLIVHAKQDGFSAAINCFQNNNNFEAMERLSEICSSDHRSHEEQWLAHYMRQVVGTRILASDLSSEDKFVYQEKLVEDRMLLDYHYLFFADSKETVVYIPSVEASTSPLEISSPKPKKTKAQIKSDKKKRKCAELVKKGDDYVEDGNYQEALRAYEDAIERSVIFDWNLFFKSLFANVSLGRHSEVIRFGQIILDGLATEEDSEDKSIILYLTHIHYADSYLELHNDLAGFDVAYAHYKQAELYQSDELLPEVNKGLSLLAYKKMLYYRNMYFEDRASNESLLTQHATEAFTRLEAFVLLLKENEASEEILIDYYPILSEAAYLAKKPERSLFYLEEELKIVPDMLYAYKRTAITYCYMRNFAKAIENLNMVLSLEKNNPRSHAYLSHILFMKGVCEVFDNQDENAYQSFVDCQNQSAFRNPRAAFALMQLDRSVAHENASQVQRTTPSDSGSEIDEIAGLFDCTEEPFLCSFVLSLQGYMYLKSKKPDLAVASFEKAADYFPLTKRNQEHYARAQIFVEARKNIGALKSLSLLADKRPAQKVEDYHKKSRVDGLGI
ncbi:MAG: hypothetical protein P1U74_04840 [Legionellaceae bacterium]|nr:hypothetical protein [Legionellaceae bacterium]